MSAEEDTSRLIERLLEHWQLTDAEREAVCRVPPGDLLAIHAQLRRLFPENLNLAHRWPSTWNREWGRRPLDLLIERGSDGALELRGYLERAGGR